MLVKVTNQFVDCNDNVTVHCPGDVLDMSDDRAKKAIALGVVEVDLEAAAKEKAEAKAKEKAAAKEKAEAKEKAKAEPKREKQ